MTEPLAKPPQADTPWPRTRHLVWLVTAFWRTRSSLPSWGLLVIYFALMFTGVYLIVWRTGWEKALFDAIQVRNGAAVPHLLATFVLILALLATESAARQFLGSYIPLAWRRWMTENYVARWMAQGRYLSIERRGLIDNPDQRIAEDVDLFTRAFFNTFTGFILSSTQIGTFSVILYTMSSDIVLRFGGLDMRVGGDLVWYALAYNIAGLALIVWLGTPLVRRTVTQQHIEADFRFALIHARRNAEEIELAQASRSERRKLSGLFSSVFRANMAVIRAQLVVMSGQSVYGSIQEVLPIFLILPKYFSGALSLGGLTQVRSAFGQLTSSLSFFTQAYTGIATMVAIIARLRALDGAIERPLPSGITVQRSPGGTVAVDHLAITAPDGSPLFALRHWTLRPGARWAITGASGTGKSTLLRAVAGLWPYGEGTIHVPDGPSLMFMPQRPYVPAGPLRHALRFPFEDDRGWSGEDYAAALHAVRLPRLADRLDEARVWSDELSPGEQQRLAVARVLFLKPDILFMDEATSALDRPNAEVMYDLLDERLPGLTLVSVVHAEFLLRRHHRILTIGDGVALDATPPSAPADPRSGAIPLHALTSGHSR